MKTVTASTFVVVSLAVIANVHATPAGITPDMSSAGTNTNGAGRGVSSTITNLDKVGNTAPDDDELPASTKTQNSHDSGMERDSHLDTDSKSGFDSAFDSDSNHSSKSNDDPDAPLGNEPEIFPDTDSFDNESSASPDTKSDSGRNTDASNELDAGSNTKAKTTVSGDDVSESMAPYDPSTDPTDDSTAAFPDDTSDDTPAATDFAFVSDDPTTWSVSAATMMVHPKPSPPPSPPATIMPLTSTVPRPSVIPSLLTPTGSGTSRMKVISREGVIIGLFVSAIAVFLS